jgi:WhiB family transcriptional regulator, redox-sensing transcriptional regulator
VELVIEPEPWMSESLCAETDPDLFFPELGVVAFQAKKICAACDVKAQCLKYAIDNNEEHGVWGGLTPQQRRGMGRPARPNPTEIQSVRLQGMGMSAVDIANVVGVSERQVLRLLSRRRAS